MGMVKAVNMDGYMLDMTELDYVLQYLCGATTDLVTHNSSLEDLRNRGKQDSPTYKMLEEYLLSDLERAQTLILKATELLVPEASENEDESAFGEGELNYVKTSVPEEPEEEEEEEQ